MPDHQPDLFSAPDTAATPPSAGQAVSWTPPDVLDDEALIAALPSAGIKEMEALADEAARRRLESSIPALEQAARLFAGFGLGRPVIREQAAILRALAAIGGPRAARAVRDLIERREVQGATVAVALAAAVRLGVVLSRDDTLDLLRHDAPAVRADACRCAASAAAISAALLERLNDHDPSVRVAAACALGRRGHAAALAPLKRALLTGPTAEVIDALAPVADEDAVVLLGREARRRPDLGEAIVEALDGCDHPRAVAVAAGLRRLVG